MVYGVNVSQCLKHVRTIQIILCLNQVTNEMDYGINVWQR